MRSIIIIIILALFIFGMNLYALRGIQHLFTLNFKENSSAHYIIWGISLVILLVLIIAGSRFQQQRDPSKFFGMTLIIGVFLMLYIPIILFNITQVLGDLSMWISGFFQKDGGLLKKYILIPGMVLGLLAFVAFGMGMARGRTNVKVFRESVKIKNLPAAFYSLRIVQLSDIHLAGFFNDTSHIRKVVKQVNELEPDLICFTGDMVHNFSEEVDPFVEILMDLSAPLGKYAVLGNHDYGAYFNWGSKEEEAANLERIKAQIIASGFDLLLNEHRTVSLNGDSLELLGVENWGKPPFPQLGDLGKAMEKVNPDRIKILLSHDPSHWDLRVNEKEDIELTLSGHTHGMQLGIEIGKFKWSPSKWTYRHWAGLYGRNGQQLYVNRGLGYTGFPGRVGIRPEITLLTLHPE